MVLSLAFFFVIGDQRCDTSPSLLTSSPVSMSSSSHPEACTRCDPQTTPTRTRSTLAAATFTLRPLVHACLCAARVTVRLVLGSDTSFATAKSYNLSASTKIHDPHNAQTICHVHAVRRRYVCELIGATATSTNKAFLCNGRDYPPTRIVHTKNGRFSITDLVFPCGRNSKAMTQFH